MTTRRDLLFAMTGLAAAAMMPGMTFGKPFDMARAEEAVRLSGRAFGTGWRVTLPAAADGQAEARGIARILDDIDSALSPFRAESELSRLNAASGTGWTDASPMLARVARAAERMREASGGAFDPCVGPAVRRFGFGPIEGAAGVEGRFEVKDGRIRKSAAGLTLDPCGIAKGHAVDRIAGFLDEAGHPDYLIDIGGELVARGRAPAGRPWRVGIENPLTGGLHAAVHLKDMALATTGDRVNAFEVEGRRYGHTIDPATGAPVTNAVASVSVLAADAMTADALATALMVMGPERGLAFAQAEGAGALYLLREDGALRDVSNAAFRSRIVA